MIRNKKLSPEQELLTDYEKQLITLDCEVPIEDARRVANALSAISKARLKDIDDE